MSITLNNEDFQHLQDQLAELKNQNYDLSEKYRRSQANIEAANSTIRSLQLKLEEQERDFQVISTTLRREIESVSNGNDVHNNNEGNPEEDFKAKYKQLSNRTEELQQKYDNSLVIVQQLDTQNKLLSDKIEKQEGHINKLKGDLAAVAADLKYQRHLNRGIENEKQKELLEKLSNIDNLTSQRDQLQGTIEELNKEIKGLATKLEIETEERRIREKKGVQVAKELKRQLVLEKSKINTLRNRLESLIRELVAAESDDAYPDSIVDLNVSTSTNGYGNVSSEIESPAN